MQNKSISGQIETFADYLKKCGLKITQQRLLVAERIFRLQTHFTVDALAESLRDHRGEISRATIYRIVSLMVDSGQLTEHHFNQNVKYYESSPIHGHHDHIVCLDCGRIDEFVNDEIEKMQKSIAIDLGYNLTEHALNLYGRCEELDKTGHCKRRPPIDPELTEKQS